MGEKQQFCTFFLNGIYFGIDVQQVQEVIRSQTFTRVPLAPPDICGLINLRGQIVTVIDLQRRLGISTDTQPRALKSQLDEELSYNIVVQHDNEVVSLLVDDVGDMLEFTSENFEPPPATLKGKMAESLRGAYKLPDGFLLILATEKVLEKSN